MISNRAARLLNKARETVTRLQDIEKREEPAPPEPVLHRPGLRTVSDDAIERWARDADERERARAAAKAELAAAKKPAPPFDWTVFDQRIQFLIERERRIVAEAFGEEVAKLLAAEREDTMRAMREEMRALKLECAKLASEAAELRAQLAIDRSAVVELPRVPLRGMN